MYSKPFLIGAIAFVSSSLLAGCGGGDESAESASTQCEEMSPEEVEAIVGADQENWKGDGELTVTGAKKVALSDPSEVLGFTYVDYIQGSAPGLEGTVFAFATQSSNLATDAGLTIGADAVTREFFVWGEAATAGSPADTDARAAVDAAPSCF